MENSSNLVQNFEYLCTRMDDLKNCRDQVEGRRRSEMNGWLQRVKDREVKVDELRKAMGGSKSYIAKYNLNMKVLENLTVVERLRKEFNAGSDSANTSLDKIAKRYSIGDINKFVLTFSKSKLSGETGDIYTGQFDGEQVAVKVLPKKHVVDQIFITEVNTIARASHRHVVKFHGFCFEGNMRALVFQYMKNGTLDKILYKNHLNLAWEKLYNIATETAMGIFYLHDCCGEQIIHHDIRAHNVLLDKDLSPNVTGFGLAKLLAKNVRDRTWTRSRGIKGYAAPEMWQPAARITAKCDVYSFGVMLFEILGKRTNGIGRNCFSKHVWDKFKDGKLDQIIRDCQIVEKDCEKATILSTLALWCIQMTPEIRPSMSEVFYVLQKQMLVTPPPNPFEHHQPLQYTMRLRVSPTIHESFPERAEEFVSSFSSTPPLKSTSSDHLNNTDNSSTSILLRSGKAMETLEKFPKKCPPGGENSVIYYTTTIKMIKTPFKESNYVRSVLQSHQIKMIERDVWGDVNYEDELKNLMGGGIVIPVVFVKGRLIGGAREVEMLEAEGKLKMLFDGI